MIDLCLFCRAPGPYTTVEHIVPESLGNTDDLLEGVVCDACQRYFGQAVERPVLDSSPFAFWRAALGIPTKKGRLPSVSMKSPKGGVIPSRHPVTDHVGFTAHPDGSLSADLGDPMTVADVQSGRKQEFRFVLSPWHLSLLGRFLGKMALEFMASTDRREADAPRFDQIRRYARYGATNMLWPIFHSSDGGLDDDIVERHWSEHGIMQETVAYYRFALAQMEDAETLFAFSMGSEIDMICLDDARPDDRVAALLPGNPACLWYSRTAPLNLGR